MQKEQKSYKINFEAIKKQHNKNTNEEQVDNSLGWIRINPIIQIKSISLVQKKICHLS